MKTNQLPPLYLLLASMSRYRAECLEKINVPYAQWAPHIDETPLSGESPVQLVQRLAVAKGEAGLMCVELQQDKQLPADRLTHIISSDQVMVLDNSILGKPHTMENARKQLMAMSGKEAHFLTSLCVIDIHSGQRKVAVETTSVVFRTLQEQQIEHYLQQDKPLDCAGSFKSEKGGIMLCRSISGKDPNALIGLPLICLTDMLLEFGYYLPR